MGLAEIWLTGEMREPSKYKEPCSCRDPLIIISNCYGDDATKYLVDHARKARSPGGLACLHSIRFPPIFSGLLSFFRWSF